MEEGIIKVKPDKEKAKSIMKMVETTLEMINQIDLNKFPSNVTKEYYDVIRELSSIIMLLDGYKTVGEGAHKRLVEYMQSNYKEFDSSQISLIDELRITRNRIAYDGFFVRENYLKRKTKDIHEIIQKLKEIIKNRL